MSDETELATYYSVGDYGPFPIRVFQRGRSFYYDPQESGEQGPYKSLAKAIEAAEEEFELSDGGFHKTIEEAEKHAEDMREEGLIE